MSKRAIILDRDGVINEDSSGYVKSLAEWVPITGSLDAVARLCRAGYDVYVITNQSGIGRGYYTQEDLAQIHQHMCAQVSSRGGVIKAIYHCPHAPEAHCSCRKPAAGMFLHLAHEHGVDLTQAFFVGDKLTDLQAGDAVSAESVLVKTGCGEQTGSQLPADHGYRVFDNLACFVQSLVADA